MILSSLFSNPMLFLVWLLAIIFAITIHEFSHAFVGGLLGDRTARDLGRVTLNPLAHLDFLGFMMLLLVGFGWGKPVPYNPYNLKYPRYGPAIVALSGPASNLIAMLFFGLILKLIVNFTPLGPENMLVLFIVALIQINIVLAVFNLIPIPPLDGSKLLFSFLPYSASGLKLKLTQYGPMILLGLIILDNFLGISIFGRIFNGILELVFKIFG